MNRKQRRSAKTQNKTTGNNSGNISLDRVLAAGHEAHRNGDIARARQLYIQILQISPNNADALHLLGVTFYQTGDYGQSVALIGKALEINPNNHSYLNNIGNSFLGLGKLQIATEYYKKSLAIKPGHPEAINNCTATLHELGKFQEEIELYKSGLKFDTENAPILGGLIKAMQEACFWDGLDSYIEKLTRLTRKSLISGTPSPTTPYHSICLPFTLGEQKQIAEIYARNFKKSNLQSQTKISYDESKKIRIGYVSGDFRDHPTAHLISGLFANHDRSKFEVFAYSVGKNDGSIFRKKIEASVDCFVDLTNVSDENSAQRIRDDGIDILMDVMGYIQNSRTEIFALKPAPVQVNYLAYPGTLGAFFINYIVTDKIVLPENEQEYFTEEPIYMPHTYFATDPMQEISASPSREQCGLPEDAFVFCCFNKSNKIDAEVFGSWVNILNAVPKSVLWLFTDNAFTRENLTKEIRSRGIDPSRLIFAGRLTKAEHLARHIHADLFLDCFNICAHTTAIDSLFSGLPLITKLGRNIISRASGSILSAIGLEKMVVHTTKEYEEMAIYYANNPDKLTALKLELAENIKSKPLFDIKAYTLNLEEGLINALEQCRVSA